jgi:hypothetical protein
MVEYRVECEPASSVMLLDAAVDDHTPPARRLLNVIATELEAKRLGCCLRAPQMFDVPGGTRAADALWRPQKCSTAGPSQDATPLHFSVPAFSRWRKALQNNRAGKAAANDKPTPEVVPTAPSSAIPAEGQPQ